MGWSDRTVKDLSKSIQSVEGFRIDDRVIDRGGNVGTVKMLFTDGRAKVLLDGHSKWYDRNVKNLSKSVQSEGFSVGAKVMYGGYSGTIKTLVSDGRAAVWFDAPQFSFSPNTTVKDLSKLVQSF
jgi:hypothetical protein